MIASTNPNRVTWVSGSINVAGSPQNSNEGGNPYIDNNETPGCDSDGINCYPLLWKTTPEFYEAAGVSWQVYQDTDNFDDNPLAWFKQYQVASNSSALSERGMVFNGLSTFYESAAAGTLPQVSYIIGPTELSEHPPYAPHDGAWLQKQVVDAVTSSPAYNKTVLIISYDETGGFGDHVTPYHSPVGTPGEWLEDPYSEFGYTYAGPGYRLPFYIVSPWTRGGAVFTEHADHNSQILFIEQWLASKGLDVVTDQMVPWRRQHMSDLVSAFDFQNPDCSIPDVPDTAAPHKNAAGVYDGSSFCEATYKVQRPPVPYTSQNTNVAGLSEQGFKPMRGSLTEGRYITIETNGYALSNLNSSSFVTLSNTTAAHNDISQRWIVHAEEIGSNLFTISSAKDGRYIGAQASLVNSALAAQVFETSFTACEGYSFQPAQGQYLSTQNGRVAITTTGTSFNLFSVTYSA